MNKKEIQPIFGGKKDGTSLKKIIDAGTEKSKNFDNFDRYHIKDNSGLNRNNCQK